MSTTALLSCFPWCYIVVLWSVCLFYQRRQERSVVVVDSHYPPLLGRSCFTFEHPFAPAPSMQSFKFAIQSFLVSALAVCAVKNITVDDFDPRIVYKPSVWVHENVGCPLYCFWQVLIYGSRRVVPHSSDLISPRAIPEIQRWRRSNSTAQQFTSFLTGCHYRTQTNTRSHSTVRPRQGV